MARQTIERRVVGTSVQTQDGRRWVTADDVAETLGLEPAMLAVLLDEFYKAAGFDPSEIGIDDPGPKDISAR